MNENNEERKKPLYISSNVLERKDLVEGFGGKEVGIIGITVGIVGIFFFAAFLATGNVIAPFLIAIFLLFTTILTVRKDPFNENLIDKLRFVVLFSKTQKRYQYHYTDCLYGPIVLAEEGEEHEK